MSALPNTWNNCDACSEPINALDTTVSEYLEGVWLNYHSGCFHPGDNVANMLQTVSLPLRDFGA